MRTDRVRCAVPFCRRTRRQDGRFAEYLCQKHWPLVPKNYRRALTRVHRRLRADPSNALLWKCERMMWTRVKAKAIERAAGI